MLSTPSVPPVAYRSAGVPSAVRLSKSTSPLLLEAQVLGGLKAYFGDARLPRGPSDRPSAGPAVAGAALATVATAVSARRARRTHGRFGRAPVAVGRWAFRLDVTESSHADLASAVAEVANRASAAGGQPPNFALLAVPPKWVGDLAAASKQLRDSGVLPGSAPLISVQAGAEERLRLGLARGDAGEQAAGFYVNKEQLSQAGAGLARENPVPGVPDGGHGSLLLFADPAVPSALTRNLLEALDSRYPNAAKAGLVVMPAKAQEGTQEEELDWEPQKPSEGRWLRTRDRSDGHGWMRGDPTFNPADEALSTPVLTAEFKRRPFGVKRYSPGLNGKGAMILEMQETERYKGDAMGQSAVKGVKTGMVIKSVNGTDVRGWLFEDLMDLVADQGIMDPDSKSAASWGAGGQIARQPVEEATLPVSIEFATPSGSGGPSLAPLSIDGVPRRDGVVGVALSSPAGSALDLFGCQKFGPSIEVAKAGPNPDGGFAVQVLKVNGKEMPAAAALKGYAQQAGLKSMKGISVGVARPSSAAASQASQWAVFPMIGVTKQGGLVVRCKGLAAEGLGADDGLKSVQFFGPAAAGGAFGQLTQLTGASPQGQPITFATAPQALEGSPAGTLGIVGAAVIGAAGARSKGGPAGTPTAVHRQAASLFMLD